MGIEPIRLAAHDPKSCLSANSSTSPRRRAGELYRKDAALFNRDIQDKRDVLESVLKFMF